jgi:hypothetical protein
MRLSLVLLICCACSTKTSDSSSDPTPAGPLLPPLETTCSRDADCTYAKVVEKDGQCCTSPCRPIVVNMAWTMEAIRVCNRVRFGSSCPKITNCRIPLPAVCASGRCVMAPLPPIETACSSDADCVHTYMRDVDGQCCDDTCSPQPANRTSAGKIRAHCNRNGYADNCPTKKCDKPPAIGCVSGQCREK